MTTFWFGKFKNVEVEDADTSYLEWCREKLDIPAGGDERDKYLNLLDEIDDELAYREKYGDANQRK